MGTCCGKTEKDRDDETFYHPKRRAVLKSVVPGKRQSLKATKQRRPSIVGGNSVDCTTDKKEVSLQLYNVSFQLNTPNTINNEEEALGSDRAISSQSSTTRNNIDEEEALQLYNASFQLNTPNNNEEEALGSDRGINSQPSTPRNNTDEEEDLQLYNASFQLKTPNTNKKEALGSDRGINSQPSTPRNNPDEEEAFQLNTPNTNTNEEEALGSDRAINSQPSTPRNNTDEEEALQLYNANFQLNTPKTNTNEEEALGSDRAIKSQPSTPRNNSDEEEALQLYNASFKLNTPNTNTNEEEALGSDRGINSQPSTPRNNTDEEEALQLYNASFKLNTQNTNEEEALGSDRGINSQTSTPRNNTDEEEVLQLYDISFQLNTPDEEESLLCDGACHSRRTSHIVTEDITHNDTAQSTKTKGIATMRLEDFKFHCLLGEGGYGKVVLASHTFTDELLAVKLMKKSKKRGSAKLAIMESRILRSLGTNPFCTHAFGTFQTEDNVFFAMEYLSGGDLQDFLDARAPLPIETTRFLTAEIICCLQSLHGRGIIHRDLKPSNILLDSSGHIRIADFGSAATDVFGDKTLMDFVGTPAFMSPELFMNLPYTFGRDYFALGIIVYEMSLGLYPFTYSEDLEEMGDSIFYHSPVFPDEFDMDLEDLIKDILLCKMPEMREQRVSELRSHPFFDTVDWMEVEAGKACPPFTMQACPSFDLTKEIKINQLASSSEVQMPHLSQEDQKLFCGFSFVSSRWGEIQRP